MKTFEKKFKYMVSPTMITPFPLSSEQAGAAEAVFDGDSTSINACAGSGKSHTVRAVALNWQGRVESIPHSRKLADTEIELYRDRNNINSLNFHRRGRYLLHGVKVKLGKVFGIANNIADLPPKLLKPVIDLVGKLKVENYGLDDSVDPFVIASKYEFPYDPRHTDLSETNRSDWTIVHYAVEILKFSDNDKDTIDYNDMLRFPIMLGKRGIFSDDTLVVLDEVQDYNPVSWMFLRECLTTSDTKVFMVGDPERQELMAFTGANKEIFGEMRDHYGCESHELTVNRRCSKAVVANAPNKGKMVALDDAPEGSVSSRPIGDVVSEILEGQHTTHAILSETNLPLVKLGIGLLSRGIKCRMRAARLIGTIKNYIWDFHDTRDHRIGTITNKVHNQQMELARALEESEGDVPLSNDVIDVINCIDVIEQYCLKKGYIKPTFGRDDRGRMEITHPFEIALNEMLQSDDGVTLLTGHVAKGLEWPTVFHLPARGKEPTSDWAIHQSSCVDHVIKTRAQLHFVTLELPPKKSEG